MSTTHDRREFMTGFGAACLGLALATDRPPAHGSPVPAADLALAKHRNAGAATSLALDLVLGSAPIVGRATTVLVNANTAFRHPGSIVRPEILASVLERCFAAGASRVDLVKDVPPGYWKPVENDTTTTEVIRATGRCSARMVDMPLPGAERLATARCRAAVAEYDHLLNVSIAKDHVGVRFSGALKNVMGLTAFRPTNLFCHRGGEEERKDTDVAHLASCIAELNLLRAPDLHVLDATEFLVTNGPHGPGRLGRADIVLVGRDPVAADARAMRIVGRTLEEAPVVSRAVALGIGCLEPACEVLVDDGAVPGTHTS